MKRKTDEGGNGRDVKRRRYGERQIEKERKKFLHRRNSALL